MEEPSEEGSSSDAQAAGEEEKRDNKAILEALVNGRDLKGVFQHGVVEKVSRASLLPHPDASGLTPWDATRAED